MRSETMSKKWHFAADRQKKVTPVVFFKNTFTTAKRKVTMRYNTGLCVATSTVRNSNWITKEKKNITTLGTLSFSSTSWYDAVLNLLCCRNEDFEGEIVSWERALHNGSIFSQLYSFNKYKVTLTGLMTVQSDSFTVNGSYLSAITKRSGRG